MLLLHLHQEAVSGTSGLLKEAQKIGKAILSPWSTLFAFWYRVLTTLNKYYSPWKTLSSFLKIWNMFYIYQEEFLKSKHWEFPALKGTSRLKKSSSIEWLRAQCRLRFVYLSIKSNFHKELFQINSNQSYIQVAKLLPQTERGMHCNILIRGSNQICWHGVCTPLCIYWPFGCTWSLSTNLCTLVTWYVFAALFKVDTTDNVRLEKKYHFRHC